MVIPEVNDYIRLIRDATYVLTDSFHAVSFCLNLEKQFYVYYPNKYAERLKSILLIMELTDRELMNNDYDTNIDYKKVNKILMKKRKLAKDLMLKVLDDQGYSNIQFGMNLNRMTGPFWEPGVYQIFLNYALYRYVVIEKSNKFVIALLLFDIFFTMSASGWLCAIVIIVIGIAKSPKFTNKSKIFIFIFLSLFGGIATKFVLFSKFSETFSNKSSAYIRMNDFLLGLKIFIENPILGIGFNNTEPFMMRNTYNDTGILGSSNGFMTIAYTTGIVGMVFVLLPFIYNIIKRKKERYKSVLYFIMIVFFNFSEPVYYFPFMMYILVKEYRKAFKNSTLSI